ncbi:MAG: dockerin type I repeat-containing protein, partial [Deltaproteobacteria bacterium]|nr:dockerin type I repeat-containing protein [Deltaproteobacteria bacterium]
SSLSEGQHTVSVIGKDTAGNWQSETSATTVTWTVDPTEKGDIDGSGVVDLTDVILAIQVMSRITPAVTIYKEADVNGDGRIGLPEVIYILQKVGEIR